MNETMMTRARNCVDLSRWTREELKTGLFEQVVEARVLITKYPTDRVGKELR